MLRRAAVAVLFLVLMPATVQAFDHHHHHHSSSGGNGCGSSSSSSSSSPSATASPEPSAPSGDHHRVFVTSTTYSGALGSVEAADAQCQKAADSKRLPGAFRAWISDATTNAYDRTADAGPWFTMNDGLAFASKADLRGAPATDLVDESGQPPAGLGAGGAWSGSNQDGEATGNDCNGWTNAGAAALATTGSALGKDPAWGGDEAPLPCNAKAPLICFQQ